MKEIVVISDSAGYHLEEIVENYNSHLSTKYSVKTFSYVRTIELVKTALKYAYAKNAIVIYTILSDEHSKLIHKFCSKYKLRNVDFYNEYAKILKGEFMFTDYESELDDEYFTRVECIEFAIENDDGKNYRRISEADVVILGVSRTGKTPLSMFLALKGLKAVNIPLFNGINIPDNLYKVPRHKIFGLINSVDNISSIRKNRIKGQISDYSNKNTIINELNFAYDLYSKLGCDIINTEDQAVEEVAHYIENKIKERF